MFGAFVVPDKKLKAVESPHKACPPWLRACSSTQLYFCQLWNGLHLELLWACYITGSLALRCVVLQHLLAEHAELARLRYSCTLVTAMELLLAGWILHAVCPCTGHTAWWKQLELQHWVGGLYVV